MSAFNKGALTYIKLKEALSRWQESETAKQPDFRYANQFSIKFEFGAMLLGAVASNDTDDVIRLIREGADVNYANIDGLTSLHQACIDESFDMVKLLIDNGAYIDASDNEGWTSLHAAASGDSLEIVRFLVSKGADVCAVNYDGELPVDLATNKYIVKFLEDEIEKRGVDADSLREAEENAMLDDIEKWSKLGKIENIRDPQGATPLHVAASKGYIDVAEKLLSIGADPNERDKDGWTPLHAAAYWKHADMCELLIEKGANMNSLNNTGAKPVDLGDKEIATIFARLSLRYNFSRPLDIPKLPSLTSIAIRNIDKPIVGILKQSKSTTQEKSKLKIMRPPPVKPISIPSLSKPSVPTVTPTTERATRIPIPKPVLPKISIPSIEKSTSVILPPKRNDLSTNIESSEPRTIAKSIETKKTPEAPISSNDQRLNDAFEKIGKLEQEVASLKTERNNLMKIIETLKKSQFSDSSPEKSSDAQKTTTSSVTRKLAIPRPPQRP